MAELSDKAGQALWSKLRPSDEGLVPCISQDHETGAVLMLAWVSETALIKTVESGWATYWSRSRRCLWTKGESSGNRQKVQQIRIDCDGDTLLYRVDAHGPACHLKTDTCFSERWQFDEWKWDPEKLNFSAPK